MISTWIQVSAPIGPSTGVLTRSTDVFELISCRALIASDLNLRETDASSVQGLETSADRERQLQADIPAELHLAQRRATIEGLRSTWQAGTSELV
jgi:hypothetical protein